MMAYNGIMLAKIKSSNVKENQKSCGSDDKAQKNCLEFKVEKIFQKRTRLGKVEYLIQWEGFGHIEGENTWELREEVLLAAPEIVSGFDEEWRRTFDQCMTTGLTTKTELSKLPFVSRLSAITTNFNIWPSSVAGENNSGDEHGIGMVGRRRIPIYDSHLITGANPFLSGLKNGELVEGQTQKFEFSVTDFTQGNSVGLNKTSIGDFPNLKKKRRKRGSKLPVRLYREAWKKKPLSSPDLGSANGGSTPNTPVKPTTRKCRVKRAPVEQVSPPLYCDKRKPIKRQVPLKMKRQRRYRSPTTP